MTDLKVLASKVMDVVRKAASLAKEKNYSITEKEGASYNIVTSADLAVQAFLAEELRALIPGSGFYGEENHLQETDRPVCWIVDPIDGTANFARNLHQSAISVALKDGEDLVLGVVYNFDLDHMFWGIKGGGSYLNGERLHVSDRDFEHSMICTALCLYRKQYTRICSDILTEFHEKCADFRRFGVASLELCYMASGRIDGYFEFRLYPWDFAAATVIVREAGGVIGTVRWDDGNIKISDRLVLDAPSPVIGANCCENHHKIGEIVLGHMGTFETSLYNL